MESSNDILEGPRVAEAVLARAFPTANGYKVDVTNLRTLLIRPNAGRTKLIVQNLSGSVIEIGDQNLQFGSGIQIAAGATYFDDIVPFTGEWYAIASVVGPLDVRVRDESRQLL